MFQYPEYQLFEETVYKDIAFGPKNMGLSPEEVDRRVREAAGFVGLYGAAAGQVSPFDLSGGQKRRVAIAGVIAMEPEVLILDEPTAGLDPVGRSEILGNIQSYRKAKNATIMMVSHSMEDVARLTDRLLVMNGSKLAMDAPPAQVFTHAEELTADGTERTPGDPGLPGAARAGAGRDQDVYTIEQAAAEHQAAQGGERPCLKTLPSVSISLAIPSFTALTHARSSLLLVVYMVTLVRCLAGGYPTACCSLFLLTVIKISAIPRKSMRPGHEAAGDDSLFSPAC